MLLLRQTPSVRVATHTSVRENANAENGHTRSSGSIALNHQRVKVGCIVVSPGTVCYDTVRREEEQTLFEKAASYDEERQVTDRFTLAYIKPRHQQHKARLMIKSDKVTDRFKHRSLQTKGTNSTRRVF